MNPAHVILCNTMERFNVVSIYISLVRDAQSITGGDDGGCQEL